VHRRVKLVFDGRKGDRVRLLGGGYRSEGTCSGIWLVRDGMELGMPTLFHSESRTWVTGYWRLPATDRYAFKVRACGAQHHNPRELQLQKLRFHKIVTPGTHGIDADTTTKVLLTRERGYVDAAVFRLPRAGRWKLHTDGVKGSNWWVPGTFAVGTTGPGMGFYGWYNDDGIPDTVPDVLVGNGDQVQYLHRDFNGKGLYNSVLKAGQRLFVIPSVRQHVRVSVRRVPAPSTQLQVGGPAVQTTVGRRPRPLVSATVTSPTDQWVQAAYDDGGNPFAPVLRIIGPTGDTVIEPSANLVRLPAGTSTVWFGATDDEEGRGREVGLRLDPIRELPAVPTDGTAMDFTAANPGEWVIAPLTLDARRSYKPEVTSVRQTSSTAAQSQWVVEVRPYLAPAQPYCRECPDAGVRSLMPQQLVTTDIPASEATRRGFVLLRTAPTWAGTVTFRMTPTD
jgi:hypothetical protein